MTQLDVEIAALRARRRSPGLYARLRSLAPFDRRSIREPDERDVYWVTVQRRLAESSAEFLLRHAPLPAADRGWPQPGPTTDDA